MHAKLAETPAPIQHLKHTDMSISPIKQYVDWILQGDETIPKRLVTMTAHRQEILEELAMRKESLRGVELKIARYQQYLEKRRMKDDKDSVSNWCE